jgi:hypothetical protein
MLDQALVICICRREPGFGPDIDLSTGIAAAPRRADDKMRGCLEAAGIVKAVTWIALLSGTINEILVLPENQP